MSRGSTEERPRNFVRNYCSAIGIGIDCFAEVPVGNSAKTLAVAPVSSAFGSHPDLVSMGTSASSC